MHFLPFVLDVFLLALGHVEKSGQWKKWKGETLAVATADGVKENRVSINMQFKLEIFFVGCNLVQKKSNEWLLAYANYGRVINPRAQTSRKLLIKRI